MSEFAFACSFCGKRHHEVAVLVQGPTVHICDECVKLATEIIAEKSGKMTDVDFKVAAARELNELRERVTKLEGGIAALTAALAERLK